MNKRRALLMALLGGCVPFLKAQNKLPDLETLSLSATNGHIDNYTALRADINGIQADKMIVLDLSLPLKATLLRLTVGEEIVTITAKEALAILRS